MNKPTIPQVVYPQLGPEPLLLTRNEVDELYDLLAALVVGLENLKIRYMVTAGSLLGAVRSQSILFHDDTVNLAIFDEDGNYERLLAYLPRLLSEAAWERSVSEHKSVNYTYQKRPWVACDRVTSSAASRVWIDVFVLREYHSIAEIQNVICLDENGQQQAEECIQGILSKFRESMFPMYHYDNHKAIELWPRQFVCPFEIFPLQTLNFGPVKVQGPRKAVRTLRRFFGNDCFTHYTGLPHASGKRHSQHTWEAPERIPLSEDQYLPVQHSRINRRVWSQHCRKSVELLLLSSYKEEHPEDEKKEEDVLEFTHQMPNMMPQRGLRSMSRVSSCFSLPSDIPQCSEPSSFMNQPQHTELFGLDITRYTEGRPEAPEFDKNLRDVMEQYISKARIQRERCRLKLFPGSQGSIVNGIGTPYPSLRKERCFLFNEDTYPIHRALAELLGVNNLALIHEQGARDKKTLMEPLLCRDSRRRFHKCFDTFVTTFCIPLVHSLAMTNNVFHTSSPRTASTKINYRYQAFPCIRIVRPGELSEGPHCDVANGHSIGGLNFHIPLTPVYGTNALYTESMPGREDWHPLTSKSPGLGYLFDGARCIHFTLENTTPHTRVSIDFRIAIYREEHLEGGLDPGELCTKGMLEDAFSRAGAGYYEEALIDVAVRPKQRTGPMVVKTFGDRLLDPDKRVGFPFTN